MKIDPNIEVFYRNRGVTYNLKNSEDFEKAIKDSDKAIELNPSSEMAYFIRALILSEAYNIEKAIEAFDKAIELNPSLKIAYFMKGYTLYKIRNIKQCKIELDKIITPDYDDSYNLKIASNDNNITQVSTIRI